MCEILDRLEIRGIEKGIEKGIIAGKDEKGMQVFRNMMKRGFSVADAQSIAEISDEQVRQVLDSMKKIKTIDSFSKNLYNEYLLNC